MVYQHKLTGELYELMILSLIDLGLASVLEGEKVPAMALGSFVLHNPNSHEPIEGSLETFGETFEFFDFV